MTGDAVELVAGAIEAAGYPREAERYRHRPRQRSALRRSVLEHMACGGWLREAKILSAVLDRAGVPI